jgi:4-amino-4-deoxy-L-arabinose transferase-like glycosyltransferase
MSLKPLTLRKILLLGISLRVLWILLCPNEPTYDQYMYDQFARILAQGKGYAHYDGTAAGWWPVGYSALLAPFYFLFGAKYVVAYVVNTLLGCLSIWMCFLIGRDLVSERAGYISALLFSIYPTYIFYTTIIGSENAAIPAALLFVWLCIVGAKSHQFSLRLSVLAGIALAAAAYIRPPSALLGLITLLLGWVFLQPWKRVFCTTATVGLVSILFLLPWGFRNLHEFNQFSLFSLNGSSNFWMGNHEGSNGGYAPVPLELEPLPLVESEKILGDEALQFVMENPFGYARLCAARVFITLKSDTIAAVWNAPGIRSRFGPSTTAATLVKVVCSSAHYFLLIGVAASIFSLSRTRNFFKETWFLLIILGINAVPFIFVVGGNRYHLPAMSFAILIVGIFISERRLD